MDSSFLFLYLGCYLLRNHTWRGSAVNEDQIKRAIRAITRADAMRPSRLGRAIRYKLGAGGRNPSAPTPETIRDGVLGSDCVGFALWCHGIDRFNKLFPVYGGWMNTDSLRQEALEDKGEIDWVTQISRPEPGCLVVYGAAGKKPFRRIGHVGLVVNVPAEWDASVKDCWRALGVIDCRSSSPAIELRNGLTWWGRDRFLRLKNSIFLRVEDQWWKDVEKQKIAKAGEFLGAGSTEPKTNGAAFE